MPARPADAPGRVPPGTARPGVPFHRAKSRGSRLRAPGSASPAGCMSAIRCPDSAPYSGNERHVEVDVTVGGVGVPGVDQPPHQRDHRGDVAGGPRLDGRREAPQDPVGVGEVALVARGHGPPRPALLGRPGEDLVVDVGHVAHEGDVVARGEQPALQDVEADARADVPDVRRGLDGGPADVDRHASRLEGDERARAARRGVVKSQGHRAVYRPPGGGRDRPGRPGPTTGSTVRGGIGQPIGGRPAPAPGGVRPTQPGTTRAVAMAARPSPDRSGRGRRWSSRTAGRPPRRAPRTAPPAPPRAAGRPGAGCR